MQRGTRAEHSGGARGAPRAQGFRLQRRLNSLCSETSRLLAGGVGVFVQAVGPPWLLPRSANLRTHNKPTCARPSGTPLSPPHHHPVLCEADVLQSLGSCRSCLVGLQIGKQRPTAGEGAQTPQQTHVHSALGMGRCANLVSRPAESGYCLCRAGGSGAAGTAWWRRARDI